MAERDVAWGELFARAEGKEPVESRKRQRQLEDEDPFSAYLEDRTKVSDEWPTFCELGRSVLKSCKGWKDSDIWGCQRCGQLEFVHSIKPDKAQKTKWQHLLFCFLRNVRCMCHLKIKNTLPVKRDKTTNKQLVKLNKIISNLPQDDSAGLLEKWNQLQDMAASLFFSDDSNASSKTTDEERCVETIMACDAVYYQLYYLQITKHPLLEGNVFIPHPVQYFSIVIDTNEFRNYKYLTKHLSKEVLDELLERYGLNLDPATEHPLSALHHYRYHETAALFAKKNLAKRLKGKALGQAKKVVKEHETPAPKLSMDWRDSCRDFLCHLYAYATIPQSSLKKIQKLLVDLRMTSMVEMGAGTGYMAHLFQETGIQVEAFDICPPTTSIQGNEYHGSTPTFIPIQKENTKALTNVQDLKNKALLLCYPPPDSPMAIDALRNYTARGGKVVVHIGEFKGLTGSADFERMLVADFECIARIPCLTWGTDASEVTVWQKENHAQKPTASLLLPCSQCHTREATRRCRFIRYIHYCSKACFLSHQSSFREHLKFSMNGMHKDKLDFDDTTQFLRL